MRTCDALFGWTNHELIGPYAREIFALAARHGMPPTCIPWLISRLPGRGFQISWAIRGAVGVSALPGH